jgi:ketosteroid isomerase-like protein
VTTSSRDLAAQQVAPLRAHMPNKLALIMAAAVVTFLLLTNSPHAAPRPDASSSSSSTSSAAVDEILALERTRNEAILHGDSATLAAMTADHYTFITLRGELRTKEEIVKGFSTGTFKYESREISDLKVRIYGDTAVVVGRASQKGEENKKDYSGAYRFTRVYVRQNGHWITVALQATREAAAP